MSSKQLLNQLQLSWTESITESTPIQTELTQLCSLSQLGSEPRLESAWTEQKARIGSGSTQDGSTSRWRQQGLRLAQVRSDTALVVGRVWLNWNQIESWYQAGRVSSRIWQLKPEMKLELSCCSPDEGDAGDNEMTVTRSGGSGSSGDLSLSMLVDLGDKIGGSDNLKEYLI